MRNADCYVLYCLLEILIFAGWTLLGLEFIIYDVEG